MSKVRINDLARELEVKSKEVLDVLTKVGVTEKKTHSSSLEADEAERVRKHLKAGSTKKDDARAPRAEEAKPKFDFSKISKPGDVLKAIGKKGPDAPAIAKTPPPAAVAKPASAVKPPAPPTVAAPPAAVARPAAPVAQKREEPPAVHREVPKTAARTVHAETSRVAEQRTAVQEPPPPPVRESRAETNGFPEAAPATP